MSKFNPSEQARVIANVAESYADLYSCDPKFIEQSFDRLRDAIIAWPEMCKAVATGYTPERELPALEQLTRYDMRMNRVTMHLSHAATASMRPHRDGAWYNVDDVTKMVLGLQSHYELGQISDYRKEHLRYSMVEISAALGDPNLKNLAQVAEGIRNMESRHLIEMGKRINEARETGYLSGVNNAMDKQYGAGILKEIAEALDDHTLNNLNQVATGIRDMEARHREEMHNRIVEAREEGYKNALSQHGLGPHLVDKERVFGGEPGYEQLATVLSEAYDQAARGKGKERHANGLPFHEQRMQGISDIVGSPDGMAYQVCKKLVEGLQMGDFQRTKKELLGAIVYTAGIIVWLGRQPVPQQTDAGVDPSTVTVVVDTGINWDPRRDPSRDA